jgi:hypothetical protein
MTPAAPGRESVRADLPAPPLKGDWPQSFLLMQGAGAGSPPGMPIGLVTIPGYTA